MTDTLTNLSEAAAITDQMRQEIGRAIIGQSQVIEEVLIAFLAAGHVLIEGVPGLGKTLLARALAKTFDGKFARIQFTPDLMPNDITGHVIYDRIRRSSISAGDPFLPTCYWRMKSTARPPKPSQPCWKSCRNNRSV